MRKLIPVYENPSNETERAVHDALAASRSGDVSASVKLALENLAAVYEAKGALPDVETAERYVAECWAEHRAAGG